MCAQMIDTRWHQSTHRNLAGQWEATTRALLFVVVVIVSSSSSTDGAAA